jgi:hypothetical protein
MIPYGSIALIAAIALVGVFVFVTKTPLWSKSLVVILLGVSFAWRYGFLLQAALAVCLSLYFTYLKSRAEPND